MRYSVVRSGNAGVVIDAVGGTVYKYVSAPRADSLRRYIKWYKLADDFTRMFLPEPLSLEQLRKDLYLYMESLVRAPRYVPSLHNLHVVSQHVVSFCASVSDSEGRGAVTNNMTYGNILYDPRADRIWIVDWQFFGEGYPLYEIVSFFESVYRYFQESHGAVPSVRFWSIFASSVKQYVSLTRAPPELICDLLQGYVASYRSKHSSPAFRQRFSSLLGELCGQSGIRDVL